MASDRSQTQQGSLRNISATSSRKEIDCKKFSRENFQEVSKVQSQDQVEFPEEYVLSEHDILLPRNYVDVITSTVVDEKLSFFRVSSLIKCEVSSVFIKKSRKLENYDKVWYDNFSSTTVHENYADLHSFQQLP